MTMFGRVDRLLLKLALLGVTTVVVMSLPDIRRYLKIRNMGDSRAYSRGELLG